MFCNRHSITENAELMFDAFGLGFRQRFLSYRLINIKIEVPRGKAARREKELRRAVLFACILMSETVNYGI